VARQTLSPLPAHDSQRGAVTYLFFNVYILPLACSAYTVHPCSLPLLLTHHPSNPTPPHPLPPSQNNAFIRTVLPDNIILVHGERTAMKKFKDKLELDIRKGWPTLHKPAVAMPDNGIKVGGWVGGWVVQVISQ
jgi:hypothetical protein